MTRPIRVLIADDQSLVRAGFRMLIDSEPDMKVVGEASDGATAADLARDTRPDVVLMDVQMPGTDGLEGIRRIAADADLESVRILILTTFDDDAYAVEGINAGASGFLLKNTDPAQLLHGIRLVAGGGELLASGLTRRLIAGFAVPPQAAADDTVFGVLTAREREVVALVAQGLDNEQITQRLCISMATTKTHVSRALSKLGVRDRAQLVSVAYRHGLVQPPRTR
ncbi:response regulator [Planomonospora venezuelensis]|uniref:DNA-binding NarL/FixJ family response regulator n=1 Tax=Planomonospora venezuelensis TaxID=1999 RepID=A0A841DDD9_PLAVE|nr:response regulator transcription factor [Planomonospora venezuelensis]MBB5966115.1 DNA-binding NarL/FixJ family response regulator [Planomonospora venezuelensis]GIN04637.1 DNA-binding response regulator [Planomonospora venezuelensis]